ncbi:TolC family protein [Spirosoma utsteinense]|uniref:Outer membrane protein TolC n=1 Tax=Spirosoma utsteinense TaxID=2585773 RepID=A0ABR6WBK1_9BACT|nr:TolC family protein [Spirosoma utsteinense]MBC3786741.1 outer membrane protein TolC [Spirosoma utsteinense]MBC3793317.1 outer membrane protein TolC [Spirosoma utsteinense]
MKLNSCILFSLLTLPVFAQQPQNAIQRVQQRTFTIATLPQPGEVLTLQQAIAQSTEKNYQVQINRSQEEISRNNYTKGNAGYLPVVSGNVTSNGGLQNLDQTFLDGLRPRQIINGIFNRTTNLGLNVNYTIFNGYGRSATYNQLRQLVQISTVTTRANVEATVASVATGYFDVVRQLQRLIAFTQALDISRERLELARATYDVGTRSKVDFLSAQVDYNTDSAALLSQEQQLRNAKVLLNTLLVRDVQTEFAVRDTIQVRPDLQLPPLQESLATNNPQLVAAVLNRTLADVSIRLANAQQLPIVTAQAGYNYQFINNQGGFGVRNARNNGLTYVFQATIPIFNGYNLKRQIQNARVGTLIAQNQENDQRLQLQSALVQTYQAYQNSLALLNLEVQNNKLANQNVDIAYDRYRIGNSTFVEFRDVQRNAIDAQIRLIEAEYNAKAAEIELLRLSSTITQELVQ